MLAIAPGPGPLRNAAGVAPRANLPSTRKHEGKQLFFDPAREKGLGHFRRGFTLLGTF